MLALLYLVAAALIGTSVARVLGRGALSLAEQIFAGLILGWMLATLATYGMAGYNFWLGNLKRTHDYRGFSRRFSNRPKTKIGRSIS